MASAETKNQAPVNGSMKSFQFVTNVPLAHLMRRKQPAESSFSRAAKILIGEEWK